MYCVHVWGVWECESVRVYVCVAFLNNVCVPTCVSVDVIMFWNQEKDTISKEYEQKIMCL